MIAPLLAAVALAAPVGFTENATLDARAAAIADKPVHVYCANTEAIWQTFLSANNDSHAEANGVTLTPGGNETYLDHQVCIPLLARIARRSPPLNTLGAAIEITAHESFHMRGDTDEGATECQAFTAMPSYLTSRWGFRRGTNAYAQVMRGATNQHNSLPPSYRTSC